MASSNPKNSPAMSHSSTGAKSPPAQHTTVPADSSRYASTSQFDQIDPNQPIELSGPDHKPVFPPKYTKRATPAHSHPPSQSSSGETYQSRDHGTGRYYYHNQGPDERRPRVALPPQQHPSYPPQPPPEHYHAASRQPAQPVQHHPAHFAVPDQQYHAGPGPHVPYHSPQRPDEYYYAPSHGHASHAPGSQPIFTAQEQYYHLERRQDPAMRMQEEYYQPRQSLEQQQYHHPHERQVTPGGPPIKIEPEDIDMLVSRATPERQSIGGKGSRS